MATRKYRRDKNGKFAGAGGGTTVTVGKAGGFANAAHRSRVAASRSQKAKTQSGSKVRPQKSRARRAGGFVTNAALGKKGTYERRRSITGIALGAGGIAAVQVGVRAKNENLLVAGLGAAVVGRVVYQTSGLGKNAQRQRGGKKIRR